MKKTTYTAALLGLILFGLTACTNTSETNEEAQGMTSDASVDMDDMLTKTKAEMLRTDMRKLWEDHVVWTRNVIFCLVDGLPGKDQALERLMKNQDDIGIAVAAYYGDDAGHKLSDLLHEHIAIAPEVIAAAMKNDKPALDAANAKWVKNADEISEFLCGANKNWDLTEMKDMMHDHLNLTAEEAVARIKKDYNADVKAYDKVHDEILMMADMLSDGIIKQYPDKF